MFIVQEKQKQIVFDTFYFQAETLSGLLILIM